jgi:chorismate mutase
MVCDPSHICGKRETLLQVAQKAMDLNFEGLMIESHITPDEAWSDAAQQVTPEDFGSLLNDLVIRDSNTQNPAFNSQLDELRHHIDEIDQQIIQLIAKRMDIAREIGKNKKENNIAILQMSRWENVLDKRMKYALSNGLSSKFALQYLQEIHNESIRQQTAIMNETELEKV